MGNNHWKYEKKNSFRLLVLSLKSEGIDEICRLVGHICEPQEKLVKKKKIVKSSENELLYKYKKKYLIEVVKAEPLPHLWIHPLATADAIIYIISDEKNSLANIKDITELMLDERTKIIPMTIVISNSSDKYDSTHFDEINSALQNIQTEREFPAEIKSISGYK